MGTFRNIYFLYWKLGASAKQASLNRQMIKFSFISDLPTADDVNDIEDMA